jgi:two-component system sensor histidine kinase QseC
MSLSILFIISLWAVFFYFNMLDEIKESVDEGLDNYKRQIIFKIESDSTILSQNTFDEGFFSVQKIDEQTAFSYRDRYNDTMMYMQDSDDEELELEPVRILSTAFEYNGDYYELKIINSMVEEDDLISEMLWEAFWLYLILVVSIILINNFVLQRLWRPFYSLLDQLKKYRFESSHQLPEVTTKTKEFTDLQDAINTWLKHSLETFDQQKQFIGNASHELQTPLAIAINKMELLLEKGNLDEVQMGNLAEIMEIIERMVRLNRSLLLLTKIENKQFLNNQTVSINELVQQSISDLEDQIEFKKVHISVEEQAQLSIQMDPSLATIIVSNLIRNALFHNKENGFITIQVTNHTLKVSNSGLNAPLHEERIFSRFYKSDSEQSGTGLGLAIVKAICKLYDFHPSYSFKNEAHCFEINFKQS